MSHASDRSRHLPEARRPQAAGRELGQRSSFHRRAAHHHGRPHRARWPGLRPQAAPPCGLPAPFRAQLPAGGRRGQGGRINVVEESESLLFTNVGDFLPGTVVEVIRRDAPPEIYRNRFLAEAMVNLGMIDTIGSGIKRMFQKQRDRNFPMPDYDLSEAQRV